MHISFALERRDVSGCTSMLREIHTAHPTKSATFSTVQMSLGVVIPVVVLLLCVLIVSMCRKRNDTNEKADTRKPHEHVSLIAETRPRTTSMPPLTGILWQTDK